ncbi:MAG: spore protease YyaC [Bacillota bacterium]|nr:spore protease YyaC [Bacillota bacterium]
MIKAVINNLEDFINKPLDKDALATALQEIIPSNIRNYNVVFFCVGTDRSTGDSLGPLVGSFLKNKGYNNVIGTLEDTVNGENICERLKEIPNNKTVIVIDSTLSDKRFVGNYFVNNSGLKPGAGVGKLLPAIGDFYIAGAVTFSGPLAHHILQTTKLSLVIKMAEDITEAIETRFSSMKRMDCSKDNSWKIVR